MKSKSLITLGLTLLMAISGYVGYNTYQRDGLGWRQSTNLPMSALKLEAEKNKYWWSGSLNQNFFIGNKKIIIYGDSQAFDIFAALKNDPQIGLIYFPHSFKCSAFFTPNIGFDGSPELCRGAFDSLLKSKEIKEAQYLIYAHEWERLYETPANYPIGIKEIKKINPKIQIIFFGPKPYLKGGNINTILRNHSAFNVNQYLNSIKRIDHANNQYVKELSENLGIGFVDVTTLFCDDQCPFFINNNFTYFDSNHWTTEGGKLFYDRLLKDSDSYPFLAHSASH